MFSLRRDFNNKLRKDDCKFALKKITDKCEFLINRYSLPPITYKIQVVRMARTKDLMQAYTFTTASRGQHRPALFGNSGHLRSQAYLEFGLVG